jgi:hypothetical protein
MFESAAALFLSKLLPVFAYPLGLTILLGLLSGEMADSAEVRFPVMAYSVTQNA